MLSPKSAIDTFRALHASGCFVMPNPWDVGSAVFLEALGFPALATTSAGFAFACAQPDTVTALQADDVIAHARTMAAALTVPLSADFQHGYAPDAEGVAGNVAACLRAGAAGLSIEDATGDGDAPIFDRARAVERLRAACAARDVAAPGAIITGRCEAWLVGADDPLRLALERLPAYAEAGADCLFAPGVQAIDEIKALVAAVAPKPLNVIVSEPNPELTVARLADLGVRRISVGSVLARTAWGGFIEAAHTLRDGSFAGFAGAASFETLNTQFAGRCS